MFKILLKSSIRFFLKERFYSIINILGLALGVASAFMIAQYVNNELSYDDHHPDVESIYRVNQTAIWSADGGMMGSTVLPLAEALKSEYSQITSSLRINTMGTRLIKATGSSQSFSESGLLTADSTFFDFFGFELAEGDPNTALDKLNTVVISHDIARKYFGNEPALGKTLLLGDNQRPIEVTGVLKPEQKNTHFNFDILFSMYTNGDCKYFEWSWIWTQVVTYVKVNGDINGIQNSLHKIADKYSISGFQRLGIDFEEFEKEKGEYTFSLQPVNDIHLNSRGIENRLGVDGDILYVRVFSIVAIVILALACINFINLTTARAVFRAKEIGIKKVLGSSKKLLIGQLLVESLMISTIATALGMGFSELLKIGMEVWLGLFIPQSFNAPMLVSFFLLFPLFIGLAAGSYPAFYLTNYKPVNVLKGQLSAGKSGNFFRNGLVTFQFVIAISLMICTMVVYQQLTFFQESNMGFKRDNVIVIEQTDRLKEQTDSFLNSVNQLSGVQETMVASTIPGFGSPEDLFAERGNEDRKVSLGTTKVNANYLKGLGIDVIAGRNLKEGINEPYSILINELAAEAFGWTPEEAIGKQLEYYEPIFTIIGVVKNYHTSPLYYQMAPIALFDEKAPIFNTSKHLMISMDSEDAQDLIQSLSNTWKSFSEDLPFNYFFLDERLASHYENESQLSRLFIVFTSLALLIGSIGLFGLSAFVASRRAKELGVRKVLGATVSQLVMMVNKSFSKLILVACLIAAPMAWWLMTQWLQNFKFHIDISPLAVAACIISALVFTWLVAGYHSLKAAVSDPVKSLRDE